MRFILALFVLGAVALAACFGFIAGVEGTMKSGRCIPIPHVRSTPT